MLLDVTLVGSMPDNTPAPAGFSGLGFIKYRLPLVKWLLPDWEGPNRPPESIRIRCSEMVWERVGVRRVRKGMRVGRCILVVGLDRTWEELKLKLTLVF